MLHNHYVTVLTDTYYVIMVMVTIVALVSSPLLKKNSASYS